MDGFSWTEDYEVSRTEIRDAFLEVSEEYPVDPERVIVGGFSAGAMAALDLVLEDIVPVRGFVALCPGKPENFSVEAIGAAGDRGLRGTILTTEMDPRVGEQREMVAVMEREGFPHEFHVTPDTGHWYPEDLAERIDEAIRHILAEGR
jgi:predicted esterase